MKSIQTKYSLELIAQRRAEKAAELEQATEKIARITHNIVTPPKSKNTTELWMHYASNGITTFNSIITCVKVYRRIKGTLDRKKKNKKKKGFFSWL